VTEPNAGRVNIALTGPAEIAKDEIRRRFPFAEGQQIIRVGMAYAIRCQLAPARGDDFGTPGHGQNLNVGSFDPNGDIRAILRALYPDTEDSYALAETLMSLGLVRLWSDIQAGTVVSFEQVMYETVSST
jgi:hypothetical protein